MKTLIKLIVAAVVLNAAVRYADAEWKFYKWKDSSYQTLTLGVDTPPDRLREQILARAADLKLPVAAENVAVTREGLRTSARGSYRRDIELFPGYLYPRDFAFTVEVAALR
jgi:hypothetical protein